MTLEFKIKPFKALSIQELYELLQLRSEVFVVEQDCVYQDMDGKDQKADHVLGYYNQELVAYTRLFNAGDYFNTAAIGRVVIAPKYRDRKWGYDLMNESIKAVETLYGKTSITISAQMHLQKFYENLGFVKTSEMYLEDGIPHIEMKRVV
jgi:ElaA protein